MFLTSEEREAIVFYKMTIDYKLPQSLSAQARYLVGDRPICYGTLPLKNGFCITTRYALLKSLTLEAANGYKKSVAGDIKSPSVAKP